MVLSLVTGPLWTGFSVPVVDDVPEFVVGVDLVEYLPVVEGVEPEPLHRSLLLLIYHVALDVDRFRLVVAVDYVLIR
jgi:hypothetical protein